MHRGSVLSLSRLESARFSLRSAEFPSPAGLSPTSASQYSHCRDHLTFASSADESDIVEIIYLDGGKHRQIKTPVIPEDLSAKNGGHHPRSEDQPNSQPAPSFRSRSGSTVVSDAVGLTEAEDEDEEWRRQGAEEEVRLLQEMMRLQRCIAEMKFAQALQTD